MVQIDGSKKTVEIDGSKCAGQNRLVQINRSKHMGPNIWVQKNWVKLTDFKRLVQKGGSKSKLKRYPN